ncbi:MAG TPA: S41 family peptidase [Lapillicoccus sp.]|nr:S41 family peptidase [Lapillicoccus sp.]
MTTALIETLAHAIETRYVFAEVGATAAADVRAVDPDGLGPDELAAALTTAAQSGNHDRHLRIRRRPPSRPRSDADWRAHYAADARRSAGGIRAVTHLDDHTGLLAIAPYTSPPDLAEPYVRAAFTLLSGVERLVVDLREGRGGVPETVAMICGYLLGDEPVHLQDLVGRDGTARQYWSVPAAGRLAPEVSVCVLTSSATFSGCEELAYNLQAQERAVVVGESTGGGAHPVTVVPLSDELEVSIPVERSVNAVTGTNWEQVGVVPDVECPAAEALERALV